MNPRKLRMFLSFILLLLPALSHANIINYSYSQLVNTPPGFASTNGTSYLHLTFSDNNGFLTLTTFGLGTLDLLSSTDKTYTTAGSAEYSTDFNNPSYYIHVIGLLVSPTLIQSYPGDEFNIFDNNSEQNYSTIIHGSPTLLSVPGPPSWLLMLTGLGILIPLHRRHAKTQRKSVDGAKGLAV